VDGLETIFLVVEPDHGGEGLLESLKSAPFRDRLRIVRFNDAKDASELHLQTSEEGGFIDSWVAALEAAVPVNEPLGQEQEEQASRAWEACGDLAREPRILDAFVADLRRLGVVGEERAAQIVFLAVVSRLLD
jgi:hypothetical protein